MKLVRVHFSIAERAISKIVLAGSLFMAGIVYPGPMYSQAPRVAASDSPAPIDAATFAAELRSLEAKLLGGNGTSNEVNSLLRRLPSSWRVETAERQYEISSEPLRDLLVRAAGDDANRKQILEEASGWAENAATQAESYSAGAESAGVSEPAARATLDQILKRREFSPAAPPSAWDLMRQRINAWLAQLFEKLFGSLARHPLGSKLFFWFVIFGVVCWIVTTLVQFWTRAGQRIALANVGTVAAHRSWQEWIRSAQEAAGKAEFREAVHCVYWAGITRLEDLSILTVDHTRTPREQLRMLTGDAGEASSATPEQRERMAGLTRQLEYVWYGDQPATTEMFRECMQRVEDLGCRLN